MVGMVTSGFGQAVLKPNKKARKFYEIPEEWTGAREMLWFIQKRMGLPDEGMENLSRFTARTAGMESDFKHWAINPDSQAGGMYQFIESPANNSVTTAVNRAMANYTRNGKDFPKWLKDLAQHKEVLKLTPEQQTTLFLANIGESGEPGPRSDPLIRRVHSGDPGAEEDLYEQIHYRATKDQPMTPGTRDRLGEWFAGTPQGQNTWPKY